MPIHPDYTDFSYEIPRGANFEFRHVIKDRATLQPVNITSWGEIFCTGKLELSDTDAQAVFQLKKSTGGIVVVTASAGLIEMRLVPANTTSLTYEKTALYGDIRAIDSSGRLRGLSLGEFIVIPVPTRSTS